MKRFEFEDDNTQVAPVLPTPEITIEKPTAVSDDLDSLLSGYTDVTEKADNPFAESIQNRAQSGNVNDTSQQTGNLFYKTGKKAGQPRKPKVTITADNTPVMLGGDILSGALALTLMDMLFPAIIVAINNKFTKTKINVSDLTMTAKQHKELAPITDKVLKQINLNANPVQLLIFATLAIYGSNLLMARLMNEKPKEQA